jgi:dTDP-4-dehydrorhamnose 3,5-epimerase
MEFFLGDHQDAVALRIPPGVLHGCKCISGPANLLYVTSGVYDMEEEGRVPHADPKVGYDWIAGPEIK